MKIEEVEGIGPAFAEKLSQVGIVTTDDLLAKGGQEVRPGGHRHRDRHQRGNDPGMDEPR